jgi:hypothetical protein
MLARYLAGLGTPPVVVTAAPEFYGEEIFCDTSARGAFDVHEVPCSGLRRASRLALVMGYRAAIHRALERRPRPDFLLFRGVPFWYFPLAPSLRRRTGIPYVLDFGDVWHMRGLTYRHGQRAGLRSIFDGLAEARAVRGAGVVTLTTEEQTRVYRDRYPRRSPRDFLTIRWGYDADALVGLKPAEKPPGVFRVAVVGRFTRYDPADAEALARAVAACRTQARMDVVHVGHPEAALVDAFAAAGAGDCLRSVGVLPYRECMEVVASAACGVANSISDVSVPVKAYDYIGLNRPILAFAPPGCAMARLLEPLPGALVVRGVEQATRALWRMVEEQVTELQPGLDPREYSQQHQFDLLLKRLESMPSRRQGGEGPG